MKNEEIPDFVKYPKIPYIDICPDLLGHWGYVFEKIDGSQAQVRRTNQGIIGGSKANYIIGGRGKVSWFPDFLKWMHSNDSLYNLPEEMIMFGEWLDPVTVEYDSEKLNKFYFIDLAFVKEDKPYFYDYNESLRYLNEWNIKGIEVLPPIERGFLTEKEIKRIIDNQRSMIGNVEIEGVVLKNYRLPQFAKSLHPKYSEIREQGKRIENYVNAPRVKKTLRIMNEHGISKPKLDELVSMVAQDIREESDLIFQNVSVKSLIRAKKLYSNK